MDFIRLNIYSQISHPSPPIYPSISKTIKPLAIVQTGKAVIDATEFDPVNPHCLDAKTVSQYPQELRGLINFSLVVWAIAWTVSSLLVTIGFLPIAYPIHKITQALDPSIAEEAEDIQRTTLKVFDEFNSIDSVSEVKVSAGKEKKELRPEAKELEELKESARTDPKKREEYFHHYSENVEKIFTIRGFEDHFNQKADPLAIEVSRESYINLNLVYRFDGPEMKEKGTKLKLIHDGKAVEYIVDAYFQENSGLVGYGLKPVDSNSDAPPRLLFRGTSGSSFVSRDGTKKITLPSGFEADAAGAIGKQAYENKKGEIQGWLEKATHNGKKQAFISGHSLGGAIAQRVAAENPHLVGKVFTLNPPRLEKSALDKSSTDLRKHMKVTHAIMEGDTFVPRVGGGRLATGGLLSGEGGAEVVLISGGGHTSKKSNDLCMRGTEFGYRLLTVAKQIARDSFWARVFNFVRPNIEFV
ncbi:MAG: hypothetical protein ACHQUC_03405 [Chlamydiales bacterium]